MNKLNSKEARIMPIANAVTAVIAARSSALASGRLAAGRHRRRRIVYGLALILMGVFSTEAAWAQSAAGEWQCTRSNYGPQTTSRFQQNFALALNTNGTFQLQGSQYVESAGYNTNFQGQGQWRMRGNEIDVQGQTIQQDENQPRSFGFSATLNSAQSMSYRMNSAATGQFVLSCQR